MHDPREFREVFYDFIHAARRILLKYNCDWTEWEDFRNSFNEILTYKDTLDKYVPPEYFPLPIKDE